MFYEGLVNFANNIYVNGRPRPMTSLDGDSLIQFLEKYVAAFNALDCPPLKEAISSVCLKISRDLKIDVSVRSRASKFVSTH